ncbi:telomerase reverse transcriptase [Stylonychia lemnae]|uniref:Telomerase reverse transcriptase n=1 Tax=Stylonychia lemnae TaxID=5949 RepID=A0A078A025_STYLE|nr:telomerase reverse transcriptase [Stylonychia lemnae]|eukprot:CDW74133.1 telomerase reverse transcriptase [Stylonychia lemnae]
MRAQNQREVSPSKLQTFPAKKQPLPKFVSNATINNQSKNAAPSGANANKPQGNQNQHQNNNENDDLHMALKSCNEIGSAKTLYCFLIDLNKMSDAIPSKRNLEMMQTEKSFLFFCHNVVLCTESSYNENVLHNLVKQEFKLEFKNSYIDLISKVIKDILIEIEEKPQKMDKNDKPNKLQTFGYKLVKPDSYQQHNQNINNQGDNKNYQVKCDYINLNKQCMITKNWERVYLLLGDTLFMHVYKEYMIFLKTRDDSLVQISGTNIFSYLNEKFGKLQNAFYDGPNKNAQNAANPDNPEHKVLDKAIRMKKTHKYNLKGADDQYTLNQEKLYMDDIVKRNRLFYCAHQNRKSKFFQKHKLNQKHPVEKIRDDIYQEVFGFNRMRKDLKKNVLEIIEHVIINQKKFDYKYYLSKNCPLPDNWKNLKKSYLEDAANNELRGQVYKQLFEYQQDQRQIANFLTEFVANVFPRDFLEGKNKKIFNKKMLQFVKFNRFESFTKISLLKNFRLNEIKWLSFKAKDENVKYFVNENEFVGFKLLKWVFEDLAISLMRCFFYCTEKQKEYQRIFYYRKNIWNIIMKLSIEDLLKQTLKEVEKREMQSFCESQNFAPGKLRLIPKGDTFRPIMTFNRKIPNQMGRFSNRMTTNMKLQTSHMMLKNLKSKMFKHSFGFPVFNYDDIMKRYEAFVTKWNQVKRPKLYFVAMDIEKCYDNVDCERVVNFLQKSDLLDKEYFILNTFVLKRKNNIIVERSNFKKVPIKQYFRYKFQKIGIDGSSYPSLFEILEDEFNDLNIKRTIIVEQEQRKKFPKQDLLNPVVKMCQNNYITFNKKQYKQMKGIPQGLCVSYILSSFYYANLEENALQFLRKESMDPAKPEINLLMRLTDDYLLMTTEKNNAMLFIEKLYQLSMGNYFKFNMKKLKTNFVLNLQKIGCTNTTQDLASIDEELFNWIGISIDTNNLNIIQNINIKKEGILCTLNVNMQTKESILWLKRKLKSFMMNNISFYFKSTINTQEYAKITLNKLFIAAAEKYVACCLDFKRFHQATSIVSLVDIKIIQIVYVVIRSFFKYLVCNVKSPVFQRDDYQQFFQYSLKFFTLRFGQSKNEFRGVYKILKAKEKKLESNKIEFRIQ